MSWRDRDWARFNDDERRQLFGGGSRTLPPSAEGATHRLESPGRQAPTKQRKRKGHRRGVSRRRRRIGEWTLAAFVAAGVILYALDHTNSSTGSGVIVRPTLPLVSAGPTPQQEPVVVAPPADVVAIRWSAGDIAPAPYAGRICVSDTRQGRICASYVAGERPADTLTREIERRGLHVESSG